MPKEAPTPTGNPIPSRQEAPGPTQGEPAPPPTSARTPDSQEDIFERSLSILRGTPSPSASPPDRPTETPSPAASPHPTTAPDALQPIPARMLNEFVYCPRLFYYEHVEGLFVQSADTVRGSGIHQRVDSGQGALPRPAPADDASHTPDSLPSLSAPAGFPTPGATDPAAIAPEIIHSRSVSLGSERLGVTAKLDLVEVVGSSTADGQGDLFAPREVIPVDYKVGSPRKSDDGSELWPADQMQLGLQILLLRENGYACKEGIIYYRGTRQRVRFELTPEREAWVRSQIIAARETAAGPIPPPLVDSPKCARCSLAPICLPDETRLLASQTAVTENVEPTLPPSPDTSAAASAGSPGSGRRRSPTTPRRLIAARDDKRALYLNTPGLRVGRSDETLTVKDKDTLLDEVRLADVSHVALFGNIQITTQAIQGLCDAEIPVTYFSGGGWFYGLTHGHGLKNVFLRIEQFRLARDPATCLQLARAFVHGKIRNHRTLLMRNHVEAPASVLVRLKAAAQDALDATGLDQLLGIEGSAAAAYFEAFAGMLKQEDPDADVLPGLEGTASGTPAKPLTFDFNRRTRRPPTDPINALLSLAYSLLSKDCTIAAAAVGFDPYVGFYHQPRFGRPALALDLMEEFRPLVAESAVLSAVNNRMVTPDDFVSAGDAVSLTPGGRKKFFTAYEQRMTSLLTHPVFDYKVSYRRALELQARILARALTGEIPAYLPLTTR